jgi:oxygen-independent coproporphyrinogen-3 oxidase
VPFCRKRCKFCYFRVYTDKNASEVDRYTNALAREVEMLSKLPAVHGRRLDFVYFGGGTPSYLNSAQIRSLTEKVRQFIPWTHAQEVTYEAEPGTIKREKLETLRAIGVTRLSLGIENFDDKVLELNGRAHLSPEISRAWQWAREVGFPQVNIDLIAGMVGETEANWRENIRKTIELSPESVTIYQLELPYNTVFVKELGGEAPVADWETKRAWVDYAFSALADAGYRQSSAYTMVKPGVRFTYRDALWHGADMIGTGVASFSHLSGVHYQNLDQFDAYCAALEAGRLPLHRAYPANARERLTRELILQLKLGEIDAGYFQQKFGENILEVFRPAFDRWRAEGMMEIHDGRVRLTRGGLLCADGLLPEFFDPKHRSKRYT